MIRVEHAQAESDWTEFKHWRTCSSKV